jgi:hypothetical protein
VVVAIENVWCFSGELCSIIPRGVVVVSPPRIILGECPPSMFIRECSFAVIGDCSADIMMGICHIFRSKGLGHFEESVDAVLNFCSGEGSLSPTWTLSAVDTVGSKTVAMFWVFGKIAM